LTGYIGYRQQTTASLIYKSRPLSNLPSNDFNSLSTENCYSSAAFATLYN